MFYIFFVMVHWCFWEMPYGVSGLRQKLYAGFLDIVKSKQVYFDFMLFCLEG